MSWAPEDFAAVAEACGLGGLRTITPWPDHPERGIVIDVSPLELLATTGRTNNPFLTQAMKALAATRERVAAAEAAGEESPLVYFEAQERVLDYHDAILEAIIVDPPWCPKRDVPRGGITPGKLNIYMLSDDVRRALVGVVSEGAGAVAEFFRPLTSGVESAPGSESLRPESAFVPGADVPKTPPIPLRSNSPLYGDALSEPTSGTAGDAGATGDAVA